MAIPYTEFIHSFNHGNVVVSVCVFFPVTLMSLWWNTKHPAPHKHHPQKHKKLARQERTLGYTVFGVSPQEIVWHIAGSYHLNRVVKWALVLQFAPFKITYLPLSIQSTWHIFVCVDNVILKLPVIYLFIYLFLMQELYIDLLLLQQYMLRKFCWIIVWNSMCDRVCFFFF